MRTKNFLKHLIMGAMLLATGKVASQVTTASNVAFGPTDFLGWDNTGSNNFPLVVKHELNQPIDWYTNAIHRMRLHPTQTTNLPLLGGGTIPVQQDGFLAISGTPGLLAPGGRGAFTRLHLADIDPGGVGPNFYAQPWGFRGWMRNGITLTGNRDQAYVGQLYYDEDESDMVIQWSDNSDKQPTFGPDRMRFLFTWDRVQGVNEGARSEEGLELMRLYPENSLQGYVGIGNYARPGLAEPEPTEQLDLLDRTVRLRDFAPVANTTYLNQAADVNRVLVADQNDGRVYWRPITDFTGQADCDWELNTATKRITTAWRTVGTNGSCPESDWNVGIGTNSPSAKLDVHRSVSGGGAYHAAWFEMQGGTGNNAGLRGTATGSPGFENYGVQGRAYNASSKNFGVHGWGIVEDAASTIDNYGAYGSGLVASGATCTSNHGVRAVADANGTTTNNYGVRAVAQGSGASTHYGIYAQAPNASPHWAGYFLGQVRISSNAYVNGTVLVTSDETLKTNVEQIDDAIERLTALTPVSYDFVAQAHPHMTMPEGRQLGLLAQQVREIFPELVEEVQVPAEIDSTGEQVAPSMTHMAVNYIGLIPVLIGAVQEQQAQVAAEQATNVVLNDRMAQQEARIEEQARRLDELEAALAACCAATPGDGRLFTTPPSNTPDDLNKALEGDARHLHIQPNPFAERTTLHYRLERAGRMQLLANSADGKALKVLQEATLEAGAYQFNWETGELTPGVYYVTLLLDGEPLVKKAVKVVR